MVDENLDRAANLVIESNANISSLVAPPPPDQQVFLVRLSKAFPCFAAAPSESALPAFKYLADTCRESVLSYRFAPIHLAD
jgi:hypothetical protein